MYHYAKWHNSTEAAKEVKDQNLTNVNNKKYTKSYIC